MVDCHALWSPENFGKKGAIDNRYCPGELKFPEAASSLVYVLPKRARCLKFRINMYGKKESWCLRNSEDQSGAGRKQARGRKVRIAVWPT